MCNLKFHYYSETDSLYIELSDQSAIESSEIKPGIVLAFGQAGQLVGIDIDHASHFINLANIEKVFDIQGFQRLSVKPDHQSFRF